MSGTFSFIRRFAPWVAIALGAILAALGVLSRTAWAPDPLWTSSLKPSEDTRLVTSDPGVLDLLAEEVTITVAVEEAEDLQAPPEDEEGEGEEAEGEEGDEGEEADAEEAQDDAEPGVVIAIARDVDAEGWIDDSAALRLTGLSTEEQLSADKVAGDLESAADPDSDLWWHVASGADEAELIWKKEPGRWSVVIASSPDKKISQVAFTWPQSTATPLATPLILAGAVIILLGAALLIFPQLLDKKARGAMLTTLRSKSELKPTPVTESDDEPVVDEPAADELEEDEVEEPEEVEPAKPAKSSRLTFFPVSKERAVSKERPAEVDVDDQAEEAPSAIEDPEPQQPQPVARFTPGTMTRRQIRELEAARREQARAAAESGARTQSDQTDSGTHAQSPQALLAELAAGGIGEEKAQPQPDSERAESTPVRRSDQWRKTWGFTPSEQFDAKTSAWLPQEVDDEEGEDA